MDISFSLGLHSICQNQLDIMKRYLIPIQPRRVYASGQPIPITLLPYTSAPSLCPLHEDPVCPHGLCPHYCLS